MAMLQAMLNESTVVDLQKKMQKEKRAAAKAEKKKARKKVRQAMDQVSERIDAELAASKSGNGTNDLRRRWMENQRTAVEGLGFDRRDHRFAAMMNEYEAMGFFGNDDRADRTANRAPRDYKRQPLTAEEVWSGEPARRAYRMPEFLWQFFYCDKVARLPQAPAAKKKRAAEAKERGNAQLAAGNLEGATSCYDEGVVCDPRSVACYNNRAVARAKQGQHELAAMDAQMARLLDPSNKKAWARELQGLMKLEDNEHVPELVGFVVPELRKLCAGDPKGHPFEALLKKAGSRFDRAEAVKAMHRDIGEALTKSMAIMERRHKAFDAVVPAAENRSLFRGTAAAQLHAAGAAALLPTAAEATEWLGKATNEVPFMEEDLSDDGSAQDAQDERPLGSLSTRGRRLEDRNYASDPSELLGDTVADVRLEDLRREALLMGTATTASSSSSTTTTTTTTTASKTSSKDPESRLVVDEDAVFLGGIKDHFHALGGVCRGARSYQPSTAKNRRRREVQREAMGPDGSLDYDKYLELTKAEGFKSRMAAMTKSKHYGKQMPDSLAASLRDAATEEEEDKRLRLWMLFCAAKIFAGARGAEAYFRATAAAHSDLPRRHDAPFRPDGPHAAVAAKWGLLEEEEEEEEDQQHQHQHQEEGDARGGSDRDSSNKRLVLGRNLEVVLFDGVKNEDSGIWGVTVVVRVGRAWLKASANFDLKLVTHGEPGVAEGLAKRMLKMGLRWARAMAEAMAAAAATTTTRDGVGDGAAPAPSPRSTPLPRPALPPPRCCNPACAGAGAAKESQHLSFCSGCRLVCYCSAACQKQHYKIHRSVCARVRSGGPGIPAIDAQEARRLQGLSHGQHSQLFSKGMMFQTYSTMDGIEMGAMMGMMDCMEIGEDVVKDARAYGLLA